MSIVFKKKNDDVINASVGARPLAPLPEPPRPPKEVVDAESQRIINLVNGVPSVFQSTGLSIGDKTTADLLVAILDELRRLRQFFEDNME